MNAALEAEVARALTIEGIAYNTFPMRGDNGERTITAFHIPFSLDQTPLNVWAYLVGSLFVAKTAIRFESAEAAEVLSYTRALDEVPLVRLTHAPTDEAFWLEAAAIVPSGTWSTTEPASLPVQMVVSSARLLHERYAGKIAAIADAVPRILGFAG